MYTFSLGNLRKYQKFSGNTLKYQEIPVNFRKYYEIQDNKHEILGNTLMKT
jgi:hypothetical protein